MKKLILIMLLMISPVYWLSGQSYYDLYGENWNKWTYNKRLFGRDIFKDWELPKYIINQCKEKEPLINWFSAKRCVDFAFGIAWAESTACRNTMNCWGMISGNNLNFTNEFEAFDRWLWSYERYWLKHTTPQDFVYKSHYCLHDTLHDGTIDYCPLWQYNVWYLIYNLNNQWWEK